LTPSRAAAGAARSAGTLALFLAVTASGAVGLTWELLYQHHSALALGVSSYGTAVTLSALMGGMGLGGLLAARLARTGALRRPLRAYGLAEIAIGGFSLAVAPGLEWLAALDARVWLDAPALAPFVRLAGTALLLLAPATAMGATIPILAPAAQRTASNLATFYALNTAGAVAGILAVTFVVLPAVGVLRTSWIAAALNLGVGALCIALGGEGDSPAAAHSSGWPPRRALALAFVSGFVIFALEVSWFRSIRAALQSTTEAFAIVLAAFLIALSAGAALAGQARRRGWNALDAALPLGGLSVLAATPLIDRLDLILTPSPATSVAPWVFSPRLGLSRFAVLLSICGAPATLLGVVFPSLLAEHGTTAGSGRLYAANTSGAVCGALVTGFLLLPTIGATHASWLAGALVCLAANLDGRSLRTLLASTGAGLLGLAIAASGASDSARRRVQGFGFPRQGEIEFVREGADSTTSVLTLSPRVRLLVIDGFVASAQRREASYMRWMGHLPALAARTLERALVICMGTGQTAAAVHLHGPELTIVDLNPAVFEAAPLFYGNQGLLNDRAVQRIVMDGRAFLRRTRERFDVVTLEPMPPNFAGSNQLYSKEFYELVRNRLASGGAVAQWVPIHLVSAEHMRAIIATFHDVFPYTRLWQSPVDRTCVLVGALAPWSLREPQLFLEYGRQQLERQMILDYDGVERLASGAPRITDDNQLLSYGADRSVRGAQAGLDRPVRLADENTAVLLEADPRERRGERDGLRSRTRP
jgi:predicted membrane-bound spermidine synthase